EHVGVVAVRSEQAVDQLRPFIGGFVGEKRGDFLGGGNPSGNIKIKPADDLLIGGRRVHLQPGLGDAGQNDHVDLRGGGRDVGGILRRKRLVHNGRRRRF